MALLDFLKQQAEEELLRKQMEIQQGQDVTSAVTPTPAQAAYFAGQMLPSAATFDARGQMAPMPPSNITMGQLPDYMQNTQPMPSMAQNFNEGNYLDVGFQGLGLLGDGLSAAGPLAAVGIPIKALAKTAQAVRSGGSLVPDDVPRLQFDGDSAPEALAEGTQRTFSTTGKYRGGPTDITSKQKLAAMQRRLRDYAEKGADYRRWYEETNDFMQQQTASRPGRQDQYAGTAAITSQGTSVPANATMAMKGYNQAIVGDPINTGRFPSSMGPSIDKIFEGLSPPLGPKREPFYEALNQEVGRARQTNDIRQARAFGYTNADGSNFSGGLSDAQHRFMDEETAKLVDWAVENKIGGVDDWNADRMQAAIWIAQKAEEEGSTIAEAGKMFQDFTPQAIIRTEAAPSASLGHLGGLLDPQNRQALDEFSALQDEAMQTPGGLDFMTAQSGAMTSPTYGAPGVYEGASNPSVGIPVSIGKASADVVDPVTGKGIEAKVIDPASRKVVEASAAMQGLLRAQDTVGYTAITKAPNASTRNALQVNLGQTINPEQIVALEKAINDEFGAGLLIPLHSRDGVSIITLGPDELGKLVGDTAPKKTPQWQKRLSKVVKDTLDPSSTEWGLNSGNLVGDTTDWTYTPSRYLGPLEEVGPEMRGLLDAGAKKISPRLEQLDAELVKDFPSAGERSTIVTRVRTALAQEGIAGVRKLVDKGLVPAFALGVLLGGQALPQATERQPARSQGLI